MQEIRSLNPLAVTGICDADKYRARHHHSTALLSMNIVEVIDQEYQWIQVEWNSFSCKTVTETVMSGTEIVVAAYK